MKYFTFPAIISPHHVLTRGAGLPPVPVRNAPKISQTHRGSAHSDCNTSEHPSDEEDQPSWLQVAKAMQDLC